MVRSGSRPQSSSFTSPLNLFTQLFFFSQSIHLLNTLKQLEHDLLLQSLANSQQQHNFVTHLRLQVVKLTFLRRSHVTGNRFGGRCSWKALRHSRIILAALPRNKSAKQVREGVKKKKKRAEFNGEITADEAFSPLRTTG